MSTYKPKNSQTPHKPLDHAKWDTPENRRKRIWWWVATILIGPVILVGGLMGLWFLVACAIVAIFKVLPLIKV